MKRGYASKNPTLLEIADVLGVQPDTVLKWIIEGKLMVALQGAQTIMTVDKNQALKNSNSGEILILTKLLSNQKWKAFSC
jgi:predicted site-specific integrase-resolvase